MEKESFKEALPKLFLDMFKKTVYKDFFLPIPVIRKTTDPFIEKFMGNESVVNIGNFVDYIIHQCYTWREWDRWEKRFNVSWVFGDKAIERYTTSKPGAKYYQDEWLKTVNLDRNQIKVSIFDPKKEHPMRKFISFPADDSTKERFLNTESGFGLCVRETLMWSPDSKACMICNYVAKCKIELGKQHSELLRLREESIKNK